MWQFCMYVAQQITKLAGEEFYKQHGQAVINILMDACSSNWEITRYPTDEEILEIINTTEV